MSETVSTDLLLMVARATPEQQAAIGKFLRGGTLQRETEETEKGQNEDIAGAVLDGLRRLEGKVDAIRATVAGGKEGVAPVSESEARRVFGLMKRLEGGPMQWKAPLGTVFRLTVLEGRSQAKAAKLCGCVPPLISRRVKTIESRFEMSIVQLRNYASVILEMEASVKGDGSRRKKHGAAWDEAPQDGGGSGKPGLVEDESGYLSDEREADEG